MCRNPVIFEVRIFVRIGQREPHAGLRGEIDHALRLIFGEEPLDSRAVFEVGFHEMEAVARHELCQPRLLQSDIVIGVEVVEPDHLIAPVKEQLGGVEANEARGAGYKDFHSLLVLA